MKEENLIGGYPLEKFSLGMIVYNHDNKGSWTWMTIEELNEMERTAWKKKRGTVSPMARVRDRLRKMKNK